MTFKDLPLEKKRLVKAILHSMREDLEEQNLILRKMTEEKSEEIDTE